MNITVTGIIDAVIMYIIVRSIVYFLRKAEHVGETEAKKIIHRHVHNRHGGHYKSCTHPECSDSTIVALDELAI